MTYTKGSTNCIAVWRRIGTVHVDNWRMVSLTTVCVLATILAARYLETSDAERRVLPLLFNGRPPWHPFGRYYRVRGSWVSTSGVAKFCNGHDECYDRREPDEWCPLNTNELNEHYGEIGCFCDYHLNRCVIERQSQGRFQYTDCSPKTTSRCNP